MKLICITGGVLSGIGKGITGSSIGALLKASGYTIFMQKFDGYLNVDAGQLDPYRHGEVFITTDGASTDLDIGHYERFLDRNMTNQSSYSMGRLYQEILQKERSGEYGGRDVQMIPHMTDLIISKIKNAYNSHHTDISIIEIGGTVGDIENEILIEALRQLHAELGPENVTFIHITYIPYLQASGELKTKPTQNSVKELRSRGINPNILILRADEVIDDPIRRKTSNMTGVEYNHVVPISTLDSIYRVPEHLADYAVHNHILEQLHLEEHPTNLTTRNKLCHHITTAHKTLTIGLVSPYADYADAHYSLRESLKLAGWEHDTNIHFTIVNEDNISECNGICIPDIPQDNTLIDLILQTDKPCLILGDGAKNIETQLITEEERYGDRPTISILTKHLNILRYNNGYSRSIQNGEHKIWKPVGQDKETKQTTIIQHQQNAYTIATSGHPEFLTRPGNIHPLIEDFIRQCINTILR